MTSIMESTYVLAPLTACFGVAAIISCAWTFWLKPKQETKRPFAALPMISHPSHWLTGHLFALNEDLRLKEEFVFRGTDANGRVGFWLFNIPILAVLHWEDVKQILNAEHHRGLDFLCRQHLSNALGRNNVLLLNGRLWKHERSIVVKSLTPKLIRATQTIIAQVSQTTATTLRARIEQNTHSSYTIDAESLMKMMTLDVFGLVAFSQSFGCCESLQQSPVARAFRYLTKEFNDRLTSKSFAQPHKIFYSLPTEANRKHAEQKQILRDFIAKCIQERQQQGSHAPTDLLSAMIKTNAEEKLPMEKGKEVDTDELLGDMITSLLFAGFDTTSITLTYMLYAMTQHPEIKAECIQEIETFGPDDPEKLVFCRAVLLETLRLYPPAFATERTVRKPIELAARNGKEFVVPAGTMVVCPIWSIHRDEHNFPRALEFLPQRWANKTETDDSHWEPRIYSKEKPNDAKTLDGNSIPAGNPEALFSFSSGARSCPGRKFALTEATIIMAYLLREFDFGLANHPETYVLNPTRAGVVQHPKGGLPLTFTLRDEKVKKQV